MNLAEAVLEAVRAAVPGVTVYDAAVPETPAERYLFAALPADGPGELAMDGRPDTLTVDFDVTAVASTVDAAWSARWMAGEVRSYLTDPGRRYDQAGYHPAGPVEHIATFPPRRDEQVKERLTVYTVDRYRLRAVRSI